MGSLTSRPSIPKIQQQPVYVAPPPQPAVRYTPPPSPPEPALHPTSKPDNADTAGQIDTPAEGSKDEENQARKQRQENLLQRGRGRLSTIRTGFRGVLTAPANTQNDSPKTLLGE